jgi:type I restriction enzyme S subunit
MSDESHTSLGDFPADWRVARLADVATKIQDGTHFSPQSTSGPFLYLTSKNVRFGRMDIEDCSWISEQEHRGIYSRCDVRYGDVLLTKDGANTGNAALNSLKEQFSLLSSVAIIRADDESAHSPYVLQYILSSQGQQRLKDMMAGNAITRLTLEKIKAFTLPLPPVRQQRKIARILTTLDNVITQTEALIAKYQAIKQGLMHDLFTRGVDATGKLRPPKSEAPELYKQSELGWIPKEWEVCKIGDFVDSLIDGPFGSNLKTEHYVDEPCVRVVRLQNISNSGYDDSEPAFITQSHANFLSRHKVVGGDVLIASLGDENHPPGRSCLYPSNLPPAVNKADCFRLRCNSVTAVNAFVSYALNTSCVRQETKRFTQGITLVRVNGTNLKKVSLKLPSVDEQQRIVQRLGSVNAIIATQNSIKEKYLLQKHGLMQDLLTGKVPVKADEPEEITP